jgi:hypothetical protein
MEEYVASTAVRTLLLPPEHRVFTTAEVLAIQRFYRVKADEEQIHDDAKADEFTALVHQFIQRGLVTTKAAYDAGMLELQLQTSGNMGDWFDRTQNLLDARNKTYGMPGENSEKKRLGVLGYAPIHVVPHVFNIGYRNLAGLRLAMYVDPAAGSRPPATEFTLDLMGGEHVYPAWKHKTTGQLQVDENREAEPIFELVVNQTKNPGLKGEVAVTIDLPERKAQEANRENNVGGFFYYVIDVTQPKPVPPTTAAKVASPLDLVTNYPTMLDPDKGCAAEPSLNVNQFVVVGSEVFEPSVVLLKGEQATLRLVVTNSSATTAEEAFVCTTLTGLCYSVGTLTAGQTVTHDVQITASDPRVLQSTATAYARGTAIQVSAPFDVVTGCQPWVLSTFDPDPNPTGAKSTIMAGGTSYRHYRVIKAESGVPWENAEVIVSASGGQQPPTFTTDARGVIGRWNDGHTEFEPGIAIKFADDAPAGKATVSITSIAGEQPICGTLPQYDVTVTPFEFKQALKAGSEISPEFKLDPVNTLGFTFGHGLSLSFDATNPASPSFSSLNVLRSTNSKVSAKQEIKSPFKFSSELGGASMGVGQSVKANVHIGWSQFDTHQFAWDKGLSPDDKRALAGLALATISGAYAPGPQPVIHYVLNGPRQVLVNTVLDWLGLGGYTAHKVSQGWTLTLGGGAGFNLLEMKTGPTPIPITGSVKIGGDARVAFTVGFNNQLESGRQVTLIEPSLAVTGNLEMTGKMEAGAEEAKKNIDTADETKDLPEGFRKRMKDALGAQLKKLNSKFSDINVEANIRFSMAFAPDDKEHPFEPKRLDMTVFAKKPFGLVGIGGGKYEDKGSGIDKQQYSRTYSVTTRDDIRAALKSIVEYNGLLDSNYRKELLGSGVTLERSFNENADLVAKALMNVVRMLLNNGEYRDAIGSGKALVDKTHKLGGVLPITLTFDTTESHTLENGVFRAGQLFKIEDYAAVSVSVMDSNDIWTKIVLPAFQGSDQHVQSSIPPTQKETDPATGGGRLTTRGAELRVANANDIQQVESLAALPFAEVQGPVAPGIYTPSDVSGTAGKPHYGIGGFTDLVGQGTLSAPAQLTLSYQGASLTGIDENSIAMYRFNEQRRDWDPVAGTLDLVNKTVSATIADLGTYTLGPTMPAGTLTWSIVSSSLGDPADPNSVSTISLVSNTVLLNNGASVPADTVFHVVSALPEVLAWEPIPFGEILTPDVLTDVNGVQVRVNASGQIELQIRLPGAASSVRIVAFSDIGTAMSDVVVAIR